MSLELYNKLRSVPNTAQRAIEGGRLKGKTDINPMWRIEILTETFGACGFGWYYNIKNKWLEHGANGEITANVEIELFVKMNSEWSKPIIGIGGSSFVTKEKSGNYYTSDECYKMALTDSISVACKALGVGADIYWNKSESKYNKSESKEESKPNNQKKYSHNKVNKEKVITEPQIKRLYAIAMKHNFNNLDILKGIQKYYQKTDIATLTMKEYDDLISKIESNVPA